MISLFEIFIIIVTLVTIRCCLRALYLINSWEPLPVIKETYQESPFISVIIPARNEEKSIRQCLNSLVKQTYADFEIIVIDDQSDDKTAEIVKEFTGKDPRVRLMQSEPLPTGWLGKCWALHQATRTAKGEYFLFSDADLVHQPWTLASAYRYAVQKKIDFLTLKYTLLAKTFWEKMVLPCLYFLEDWFVVSSREVNDMNKQSAVLAKGDFILVRRETYEKAGGHQAVKNEIVESAALMSRFKRSGHRVRLLDGSDLIRVRKFHNLKEIIDSYFKLLYYAFLPVEKRITGLVSASVIILSLLPLYVLVWMLLSQSLSKNILLAISSFLEILVFLFTAMVFYKRDNFNPHYAWGFPLGVLITSFITLKALFAVTGRKGVYWRDRVYGRDY